jgi:hypothetical protein
MSDRVQRSLRRAWRDITAGGAWTRRARWYESATTDEGVSIRLNLNERRNQLAPRREWIEVNLFFDNPQAATDALMRFVSGERALTLRNEQE